MFTQITSGSDYGTDMNFDRFIIRLREKVAEYQGTLFTTIGSWHKHIYLNSFENANDRQQHNCRCCLAFLNKYAGLVKINPVNGNITPFLWDISVDYEEFNTVVRNMHDAVQRSKISGVFVDDNLVAGVYQSGGWSHFAVKLPKSALNTNKLLEPHQVTAKSLEDHKTLSRALEKYPKKVVNQAKSLLVSGSLSRSDVALGHVKWLSELHSKLENNFRYRNGLLWNAVASAPVGFCGVPGSVLGSLMDDIMAGMDVSTVTKRFASKVDPLKYNRPQTRATSQNIKQGEEIIAKLGLQRSLERRYAILNDLELLWRPTASKSSPARSQGVFRDVVPRDTRKPAELSVSSAKPIRMTWSRFQRTILPDATDISVNLGGGSHNFSALVTAVNEDAPCIMQWGNHVNWYVYPGGSTPSTWNLNHSKPAKVTGISLQPNMWNGAFKGNNGEGVHFILEGCKDVRSPGLALFPEVLISELHPVRKTIESYSGSNTIKGRGNSSACGIKFRDDSKEINLSVVVDNVMSTYIIDRMD